MNGNDKAKEKAQKERLAQWISQEITSQTYTQKEMDAMFYLLKQGKKEEAQKILLKGCKYTCYCQKEAKTWQGKIKKVQHLIQEAEKESKEAKQLRIKETTELLFNNPQEFFKTSNN